VHAIIGPDPARPGGCREPYVDSRGVVRLYEMTLDGRQWTLLRTDPDITALEFAQRYV
jgi:hypothetical protein